MTSLVSMKGTCISKAATALRTQEMSFTVVNAKMTIEQMSLGNLQTTHFTAVACRIPCRRPRDHAMGLQVPTKQRCCGECFMTVSTHIQLAGSMSVMYVPLQMA